MLRLVQIWGLWVVANLAVLVAEGFQYLGIDSDSKSVEIAKARLAHWSTHND